MFKYVHVCCHNKGSIIESLKVLPTDYAEKLLERQCSYVTLQTTH